ncbi:hypothetical protein ABN028_15980 [Actinopolymorpha sp. B17G11]|uniref:hypothetical protein n=1 Tax=Actinopolymorpha sp. B17G11 TaxID=3160861 RepID=UPI0032E5148F
MWLRVARWLWGEASPNGDPGVGGLFRPPDVWSKDRPSLRRLFAYARWGVQHPANGPLRGLSITYAVVGFVVQAGLYYAAWLVERPARLVAGYVLVALLMQIPPVRDVAIAVVAVLIAPLTWLA